MKYNYSNLYVNNMSGILCREYASSLLDLSSFPENYIILQTDKISESYKMSFAELIKVDELDLKYTYEIKKDLFITNEERTIVEMVAHDSEGKLIDQSIKAYRHKFNSVDKLYKCAEYYGVLDKLKRYIEEYN